MASTLPNPLRFIGLGRALAGCWFVATAASRLGDASFLVPQAGRLLEGDIGGTDAPIRALLVLLLIPAMLLLGTTMIARGVRWTRRVPANEPAPLDPEDVAAVLRERRLPAYEAATVQQPWPVRGWLGEELGRMSGWRRDLLATAARTFHRAAGLALLALIVPWLAGLIIAGDILGPLPLRFVLIFPFAAAIWVALSLLLVGSEWPRIEVAELPVATRTPDAERFLESPPVLLGREPPAIGTAIAIVGVATQCALLSWWTLDTISYPHLATSIVRHLGAIVGGVLFYALGARMVEAGSELLRRVQYDSVVVSVDGAGLARGAEVRTESRDPDGERQIIAAVGSAHAREAARGLLR